MSRPAVKVTKSAKAKAAELSQRALDLEQQLSVCTDATKANHLRIPLCECLSDLILTDPSLAAKNNVCERLWRKCFYERFGPDRTKITRARKHKKEQEAANLEESMRTFVAEAITLYDYLCDKLKLTLLGSHRNGHDHDESSFASSHSTEGVVECLHRMYVHLGDLYRYSPNLQKAEGAYQRSARLGPGHGNPYNQLAVLCQMKDLAADAATGNANSNNVQTSSLSAVALFWYARSLLATNDVFGTSHSNLTRLLKENHDRLRKKQLEPDITEPTPAVLPNRNTECKQFLSQYVDLHWFLYKGICNNEQLAEFMAILPSTISTFHDLLRCSALGDSLLCKLIVIQIFGECWYEYPSCDDETVRIQIENRTKQVSRLVTLQLGINLAHRVKVLLEKTTLVGKGCKPTTQPSLRLISPLMLLTDYLASCPERDDKTDNEKFVVSNEINQQLLEAEECFWKTVVEVWNLFCKFSFIDTVLISTHGNKPENLKDYHNIRGFTPMDSLMPPLNQGFVSDEEAIQVLDLKKKSNTAVNTSQPRGRESSTLALDSVMHSNSAVNNTSNEVYDQGKLKVARMLFIADRLVGDEESKLGKRFHKTVDGVYVWLEEKSETKDLSDIQHESNDYNNHCDTRILHDDEDDAGDDVVFPLITNMKTIPEAAEAPITLVYQQDSSGGPPLLVPGVLLQASKPTTATLMTEPIQKIDKLQMMTKIGVQSSTHHQDASVFTVSDHNVYNTLATRTDPSLTSTTLQVNNATSAPCMPPPGFSRPPLSHNNYLSSIDDPNIGFSMPGIQNIASPMLMSENTGFQPSLSVLESFHLFGSPSHHTNNPFVSFPAAPDKMHPQSINGLDVFTPSWTQNGDMLFQDGLSNEGSTLLNSGLLSSLWSDDSRSKSRNPFAT